MYINEAEIIGLINEELSKSDVQQMISSKFDEKMSSSEFKKKVKELSADVVNEIFVAGRGTVWNAARRNALNLIIYSIGFSMANIIITESRMDVIREYEEVLHDEFENKVRGHEGVA